MDNNKPVSKIVIILLVAMFFVVGIGAFVAGKEFFSNPNIQKIENTFADVDGDGTVDLIVSANIIYNTDNQNLPISQLNP